LRRHVQLRDRTCVAPGCRRPARKAHLDHTYDHALGGPTVCTNVEPLCLAHHLMKHHGGWSLTQPEPGRFCWRSPLGQHYWTRGDPIAPGLPEPLPGHDEEPDEAGSDGLARQIGAIIPAWEWEKLRPPDAPARPETPEADEPPF
jgi:hypothetical protein